MVLEAVACKHCGLTPLVRRFGFTRKGVQRYHCGDCGRTFVHHYTHKARDPLVKEQITQMVLNGAGVRDTARVLKVNRGTVSAQLKKKWSGAGRQSCLHSQATGSQSESR